MKTTDYLDRVQRERGLTTDNSLAKLLGISRQAISNYRAERGSLDDKVAKKVAEILKIHPGIVMLDMYAERTKDKEIRHIWEDVKAGFPALSLHAKSGLELALPW